MFARLMSLLFPPPTEAFQTLVTGDVPHLSDEALAAMRDDAEKIRREMEGKGGRVGLTAETGSTRFAPEAASRLRPSGNDPARNSHDRDSNRG